MAKYIISEFQTNAEGVTAFIPPEQRDDRNEAESVFYLKLAYAATSNVPIHTVILDTNDGFRIDAKSYRHGEETQEE